MAEKAQKRRPRITSKGRMILQLSVLILGAGFYFLDPALILIGAFLIFLMLVSYVICWRNFKNVELNRELPDSVFADDEFYVYDFVKTSHNVPLHCISIKDFLLPDKKSTLLLPIVDVEWIKAAVVKMKINKRGVYKSRSYRVSSDFPFGFFKIEEKLESNVGITVFPEPAYPSDGFQLQHGQDNEVEREFFAGRFSYGSFRGLREFIPGDPLKLVSWSVSERSENLLVRDLEPPEPERYTVIFHAVKAKKYMPDSRQFEKCLKLLSGLFVFLQENNLSFEFYTSVNNWVPFICDNPAEPPIAALKVLAQAKFGSPDSIQDVTNVLDNVPADYHCIVLGATELDGWKNKIGDQSISLTLMDSKKTIHMNAEI